MKHLIKKIAALILALGLSLGALSGCVSVDGDRVALAIGDNHYSRAEALMYFYYMQYETEYNVYGMAEMMYGGLSNYWAYTDKEGKQTNLATCRQYALQHMIQTKILCMEAEKDGITLSEDEELLLTRTTNRFMREYGQVVNSAEASKDDVNRFIRENMLANKEYLHITEGIDTSYDEEQMKRKQVEGMTIITKKVNDEDLPPEEQYDILEYYLDELDRLFETGMKTDAIMKLYEDDKTVGVTTVGEAPINKPEGYEEGKEPADFYELAWGLSTGEHATLLTLNQKDGYTGYVARCISDDDEQLKEEAIAKEMAARRVALFNEEYGNLTKSYKKIHVYTEVVDDFQISETLYDGSDYEDVFGPIYDDTIINGSGSEIGN